MATAAAAAATPPGPLTPDAHADTTLSSWFLEEEEEGGDKPDHPHRSLALIILNHTLPPLTRALFARASLVVAADGGANRLHAAAPAWAPTSPPDAARAAFAPAAIVGDLDSLDPDVSAFYTSRGVSLVDASADQDSTDLEKALAYVLGRLASSATAPPTTILAVGALGGRLDHTLSALNTLFKPGNAGLVLLGDGNLARALPASGRVAIEPAAQREAGACGLVALGGVAPVTAHTAGLAWELAGARTPLGLGGLQSTSNRVVGGRVVVDVGGGGGGRLLWVSEVEGG